MSAPIQYGWSRAERAWTTLADASLLVRHWRSSPFAAPWHGRIPCGPGVYVITGSPPVPGRFSKACCPLYVGQTVNLRSRFGQHIKGGTSVSEIAFFANLHFHYHVVAEAPDHMRLRHYEQMLLDAFGPIANKRNAIRNFTVGKPVSVWHNGNDAGLLSQGEAADELRTINGSPADKLQDPQR